MKTTLKLLLCLFINCYALIVRLHAQTDINLQQVTASEYCDFLNHIAMTDPYHLYDEAMSMNPDVACIVRFGQPGNFHYEIITGRENVPVMYVNQNDQKNYCRETGNFIFDDKENGDNLLKSNVTSFQVVTSGAPTLTLAAASTSMSSSTWLADAAAVTLAAVCMIIAPGGEENASETRPGEPVQQAPVHRVADKEQDRLRKVQAEEVNFSLPADRKMTPAEQELEEATIERKYSSAPAEQLCSQNRSMISNPLDLSSVSLYETFATIDEDKQAAVTQKRFGSPLKSNPSDNSTAFTSSEDEISKLSQEVDPNQEIIQTLYKIITRNRKIPIEHYKKANQLWKQKTDQPIEKDQLKQGIKNSAEELKELQEINSKPSLLEGMIDSIAPVAAPLMSQMGAFTSASATSGFSFPFGEAITQGFKIMGKAVNAISDLEEQEAIKDIEKGKEKLGKLREAEIDRARDISKAEDHAIKDDLNGRKNLAENLVKCSSASLDEDERKNLTTKVFENKNIDRSLIDKIMMKANTDPDWFKTQVEVVWRNALSDLLEYIENLKNEEHVEMKLLKYHEKNWKEVDAIRKSAKQQQQASKQILDEKRLLRADAEALEKETESNYKKELKKIEKISETSSELSDGKSDYNPEASKNKINKYIIDNKLKEKHDGSKIACEEAKEAYETAVKSNEDSKYLYKRLKKEAAGKAKIYQDQKDLVLRNINRAEHSYNIDLETGKTIFEGDWPEKINITTFPDTIWP